MTTSRKWAAALVMTLVWVTAAVAGSSVPPTIDQLHGTIWASKATGTGYYLMGGGKEKIGGTNEMYISKMNSTTIQVDFNDPDSTVALARYYPESGVAVIGSVNDTALATNALCAYLVFSGTPGKLKMTGEAIDYDTASDGEASVMKITGKQMVPR